MSDLNISYDANSYSELRAEVIKLIPKLTDKWTDFNDSDLGMVMVDIMCLLSDYAAYRRDKIRQCIQLPTAKQRKDVQAALKIVGYKMSSYKSSTCLANIKVGADAVLPVIIPAYTQFSTVADDSDEPISFSNLSSVVIATETERTNGVSVTLTQGTVITENLSGKNTIVNGTIFLEEDQVGEGTISVTTKNSPSSSSPSIAWTEVDFVEDEFESGHYFSHGVDKLSKDYIQFHPVYNNDLSTDVSITLKYLKSAGKSGDIGSGCVINITSEIYDSATTPVNVSKLITVANTTRALGGQNPESIEQAKKYGPIKAKIMDTLVTLEDFEDFTSTLAGVAKCRALDWNYPESGITEGYYVKIAVIPEDNTTFDNDFIAYLMSNIDPKRMLGRKIEIVQADMIGFNMGVEIGMSKVDYVLYRTDVFTSAVDVIDTMFSKMNIDFGTPVYFSDLNRKLMDCSKYVKYVKINGITDAVTPLAIDGESILTPTGFQFVNLLNKTVSVVPID